MLFFLFFFLLCRLSRCAVLKLTSDNFTETLCARGRKPILVLFWSLWCPHCHAFEPTWNNFSAIAEDGMACYDVGSIECDTNSNTCRPFTRHGFPTIVWFDAPGSRSDGDRDGDGDDTCVLQNATYTGGHSVSSLLAFCEKQLQFPLLPITTYEKTKLVNNYTSSLSKTTLFFFTIANDDSREANIAVAKKVASSFRDEMCQFFLVHNDDSDDGDDDHVRNMLEACNREGGNVHTFSGSLSEEEHVSHFVATHLFRFLQPLTKTVADSLKEYRMPFVALIASVFNYTEDDASTLTLSLYALSERVPVLLADCIHLPFFCRYTNTYVADKESGRMNHVLILWDKVRNKFWTTSDVLSVNETVCWFDDAVGGSSSGYGPGRGPFHHILGLYWDAYGEGTGNFVMMCFLPFMAISAAYMAYLSNKRSSTAYESIESICKQKVD